MREYRQRKKEEKKQETSSRTDDIKKLKNIMNISKA